MDNTIISLTWGGSCYGRGLKPEQGAAPVPPHFNHFRVTVNISLDITVRYYRSRQKTVLCLDLKTFIVRSFRVGHYPKNELHAYAWQVVNNIYLHINDVFSLSFPKHYTTGDIVIQSLFCKINNNAVFLRSYTVSSEIRRAVNDNGLLNHCS